MPSVSVYIRAQDYEAWKQIENKAKFISDAINNETMVVSSSDAKMTKDNPMQLKRVALPKTADKQQAVIKQDRRKPEINDMFTKWEEITGVAINGQQQANRRACSNLLKKYGHEKLIQLIGGVSKAQGEQYAPQIANFVQLQSKVDSLILWGRKYQQEINDSQVVKI